MADTTPGGPPLQPIAEWRDVDAATFRNVISTRYQPAVLRGAVRHWPAVAQAAQSPDALCAYLYGFASRSPVDALSIPAEYGGRIGYQPELRGFNFTLDKVPLATVLEEVLKISKISPYRHPPAMVVQSAPVADCLPGFAAENAMPLLDAAVQPRVWIGTGVATPAHIDESNNIACVVSGRRRFTLFPPEQVGNLYLGPIDYTPTGSPISLVNFDAPDFARFPRFRAALAAAQWAELEPGDAIFIPTVWWHHVQSLAPFNLLVNYWWKGAVGANEKTASAFDSLLHSALDLRALPPEQRAAWHAIFAHFVFDADHDPGAHLPAARRGVLGALTPEQAQQVRAWLIRRLQGGK